MIEGEVIHTLKHEPGWFSRLLYNNLIKDSTRKLKVNTEYPISNFLAEGSSAKKPFADDVKCYGFQLNGEQVYRVVPWKVFALEGGRGSFVRVVEGRRGRRHIIFCLSTEDVRVFQTAETRGDEEVGSLSSRLMELPEENTSTKNPVDPENLKKTTI